MADHPLDKAIIDVHTCIENALKAEMQMPATILIYSAIDAAAWLSCKEDEHTREDFIAWVDRWMMPQNRLDCTATDLYAARCGILHTFTSKARLTRKGDARQLCYAWGASTVQEMQAILVNGKNDLTKYACIHLADLYSSYKNGYNRFYQDTYNDPVKKATFIAKINQYYRQVDGVEADRLVTGE